MTKMTKEALAAFHAWCDQVVRAFVDALNRHSREEAERERDERERAEREKQEKRDE